MSAHKILSIVIKVCIHVSVSLYFTLTKYSLNEHTYIHIII